MLFQLGAEDVVFKNPTLYHVTNNANPVVKMIFSFRGKSTAGDSFDAIHKAPEKFVRAAVGQAYFTDDKLNAGPVRSIQWADEETRIFKVYGTLHHKHLRNSQFTIYTPKRRKL